MARARRCWRIVEANLQDRYSLDFCKPATTVVGNDGRGQIAFVPCRSSPGAQISANSGSAEIVR